jgi:hypothetical protein
MDKRKSLSVIAILLIVASLFLLFPKTNLSKITGQVIIITGRALRESFTSVRIDPGIIVIYDTFDGGTTQFLYLNDTQLGAIVDMTLERTLYGKIIWPGPINLAQDAVDYIINLDKNVDIANNRIEVNTTRLPSLQKNATLYLYGLTFTDPRLLADGELCNASICQIISYTGGTLVFNVTQFFVFSAEETPVPPAPPVEAAPPGAPMRLPVVKPDFTVSKDLIEVMLKQGETERESFNITSNINKDLFMEIEHNLPETMLVISEEEFYLAGGETKTINVEILAREEEVPDAYVGRIIVRNGNVTRAINVIIIVKERKPLFDVMAEVVDKTVLPPQDVEANITILNLGDLKNIDIQLYYALRDFDGNILTFKEESIAIGDRLDITRALTIPDNYSCVDHVFYARASYNGITAASADLFTILCGLPELPAPMPIIWTFVYDLLFLIIVIILILLIIRKRRQVREKERKEF